MLDAHRQIGSALRLEWGLTGGRAISRGCDVAVVVDVLSFTTTVTVAADRGIAVLPYRWRDDDGARALAEAQGAALAVGRSRARPGDVSLSPPSVRAAPDLDRLVLPSPNGSTISAALATEVPVVVAVGLRNRRAVAAWLQAQGNRRVAVVCACEQWPDGTLRPAVEDLWGAGALVDALDRTDLAPEATAAAGAFRAVRDDVRAALGSCASGRELIDAGYPADVDVAAELDDSATVPVLRDGMFVAAG